MRKESYMMLRQAWRVSVRKQRQQQQQLPQECRRAFCSTGRQRVECRGMIYSQNGDPLTQLRGHRWSLPPIRRGQVLLRVALASVNPADINVIQGVYPAKPQAISMSESGGGTESAFVGGNEGYGVVEELSPSGGHTGDLKVGDWVVFAQPQMGTWKSHVVCAHDAVLKIERNVDRESAQQTPLTSVMASTLQVNPPTAFRMLRDFVELDPAKDVVIQNTANSAVGKLVAQMCSRTFNVPSINLVRDRPDLPELIDTFAAYGGESEETKAHVFTYEDFTDRRKDEVQHEIRKIVGTKRQIRLGLNALCGEVNERMTRLLSRREPSTLVTYGAMSRKPLSVPAGMVIFNNLRVQSFMMNRWHGTHSRQERQELMQMLVEWYEQRIIEPPPHKIVEFKRDETAEEMTEKARAAIAENGAGMHGKKTFFKFE